jgi:hypothetical protein
MITPLSQCYSSTILKYFPNVAYIVWKAESDTFTFHLATDTLVVKEGKIHVQTFAAHMEKK